MNYKVSEIAKFTVATAKKLGVPINCSKLDLVITQLLINYYHKSHQQLFHETVSAGRNQPVIGAVDFLYKNFGSNNIFVKNSLDLITSIRPEDQETLRILVEPLLKMNREDLEYPLCGETSAWAKVRRASPSDNKPVIPFELLVSTPARKRRNVAPKSSNSPVASDVSDRRTRPVTKPNPSPVNTSVSDDDLDSFFDAPIGETRATPNTQPRREISEEARKRRTGDPYVSSVDNFERFDSRMEASQNKRYTREHDFSGGVKNRYVNNRNSNVFDGYDSDEYFDETNDLYYDDVVPTKYSDEYTNEYDYETSDDYADYSVSENTDYSDEYFDENIRYSDDYDEQDSQEMQNMQETESYDYPETEDFFDQNDSVAEDLTTQTEQTEQTEYFNDSDSHSEFVGYNYEDGKITENKLTSEQYKAMMENETTGILKLGPTKGLSKKMTNLIIVPRDKINGYEVSGSYAIISISSPKKKPITFISKGRDFKGVLSVSFDDSNGKYGMKKKDADRIAEFVIKMSSKARTLIIQSDYGYSRSAGILAAILTAFDINGKTLFTDGEYCPNAHCYKLMLTAFNISYDESVITKLEKFSKEKWLSNHESLPLNFVDLPTEN